jgi:hypothetical protein
LERRPAVAGLLRRSSRFGCEGRKAMAGLRCASTGGAANQAVHWRASPP